MSENSADTTEDSLERIGGVCRFICRVMKVLFIIFCVYWLIATGLMAYLFVESGQLFSNVGESLFRIALHVVYGVVIVVLFACILGVFSDVAKGESPFSMRQVKRLRLISYMLVAYTVFDFVISWNSSLLQVGGVDVGYVSTNGNSIIAINFAPLVAAAVVFAFSFVFKYGVLLQELSDDTL